MPTQHLREGILVSGLWYPVIKMNWVAGEPLNRHIDKNLANARELARTATNFRKLVRDLAGYGIAHGDLQHGNILAQNGDLRVIDYDGLYLRPIAYLGGNNSGHPNYQHPGRNDIHYSTSIDNFSAIVIYTAMLALSQNPSLWQKYNNDENMLFRQSDFIAPDKSPLFRDIRALAKPLPDYAVRITTLCRCDAAYVPSLEDFLRGAQPPISIPGLLGTYRPRSPYEVFSATDSGALLEKIGQRVEIVGKIAHYYYGTTRFEKPYIFLNMTRPFPKHTFTIVLWSEALDAFGKQNDPVQYCDHWVSVTGVVEVYNGKPQIAVEVPSQITQLTDESEAKDRLSATTRIMRKPVPAQVKTKPEPALRARDPIQDLRNQEAEVFKRLYERHKQPAGSRSVSATRKPTSVPSSATNQKSTSQTGFWERLRRFLTGE
ncbi:MAG: hypothetical protein H8E47_11285 [Anaerolineales bacterium]|nr:hypothetical protein [Anaerolineales bacterium]